MGKKNKRLSTEASQAPLVENPFGALGLEGLPEQLPAVGQPSRNEPAVPKAKNRGRVDLVRQRSAGSGGWITVAKNFVGISIEEKNDLKRRMQKRCGVGGTLKSGTIEIQGDKREEFREVLEGAGFKVVYAGG